MNQGKRTPKVTRVAAGAQRQTDLFHPDYTVGFGLSPNLLTLLVARQALAGSRVAPHTAGGEFHPALRSSPATVADHEDVNHISRHGKPPRTARLIATQPLSIPLQARHNSSG